MIIHGKEVKEKLLQGINLVADTVLPTLGPQAKTVILQGNPPVIINDGVTITKYVSHEDPYVQMGVQMVQNLASKAQDNSGDGTTTACIVARALCEQIHTADVSNLHTLRKELDEAQAIIVESLEMMAVDVGDADIVSVATIAANNDSYLGGLIEEALNEVGRDGIITVEESNSHRTNLVVRKGLEIDEGYLSHLMANGDDGKVQFNNPLIFTSNLAIKNFSDILPMLELAAVEKRPMVMFVKGMDGSALNNIIMNVLQKTIEVAVVTAPNFGDAQLDELGDIVSIVGGRLYTDESKDDPELITKEELGSCEKIVITKETTTIIGGNSADERINTLKSVFETLDDDFDKKRMKKRISRLSGGIATIQIGASSSMEMREKKERLDDALNATKAALSEGIITGGGLGLLHARNDLEIEKTGHKIVYDALSKPALVLLQNSGKSGLSYNLNDPHYGYNALSEKYENLWNAGVFDPVKVTKGSFNAAISIASLFLTTEVAVLLEE
ncbi:chaperonin GroEL [bacterium]|jgi:chaperonin GroEL|nr:chaperonin GroEL [bacterium]